MKKYLVLYAVVVSLLLVQVWRHYRSENQRLAHNQTALMSEMVHDRTKAGQEAASAQVLRLKVGEFEQLRAADAEAIRSLGVKLKRVEATAKTATATVVELRAKLRDTLVVRDRGVLVGGDYAGDIVADTLRAFRWRDPWVTVQGLIDRDSVLCRIESVDTLRQVVHRVPRRFLFIKYGTKAIRQEIISANPHTRIVYSEYVKFEK